MLDFNRSVMKAKAANVAINEAIDTAMAARINEEPGRDYLGASSIGHECLRRIHRDWRHPQPPKARTARIFWRGHTFEAYVASLFVQAGFDLQRGGPETHFSQADGRFRGHCDGIFRAGPEIEDGGYPCLWEAKALGATSWRAIEKHGLRKSKPEYFAQVQLYMAYLGLTRHPAIFTAANADTAELLHLLVPFDPEAAQAASDRAVAVLRADDAGEELPRVSDDPGDFRCRFCNHREACWP